MTRIYPRSTLKKIFRAHEPSYQLSKDVDIKVRLPYTSFSLSLLRLQNRAQKKHKRKEARPLRLFIFFLRAYSMGIDLCVVPVVLATVIERSQSPGPIDARCYRPV